MDRKGVGVSSRKGGNLIAMEIARTASGWAHTASLRAAVAVDAPDDVPRSADTVTIHTDVPQFDLSQAARILEGTRLAPDGRTAVLWDLDAKHYRSRVLAVPGAMFESGMDGTVRGLNPDGTITWEKKFDGSREPAATPEGTLFVSRKKKVTALDETGHERWTVSPSNSLSPACAAGPEGNCYVSDNSQLYALDGQTGRVLWKFGGTPAFDDVPPRVGPDGTIYYCTGDDVLHAIGPDGQEKWRHSAFEKRRRPLFSDIKTRLAVTPDGHVCFGAADRKLHMVGPEGEKWSRDLPETPDQGTSPEIDGDGVVYVGAGQSVLAFASQDGTPRWRQDVGEVEQLTALPSGVMVNVRGQGLHGLDAAGNGRWSFPTESDASSKPVTGPRGEIFIGSEQALHALSPLDRFAARPDGPPRAAPTIETHDEWIMIGGVRVPVRQ